VNIRSLIISTLTTLGVPVSFQAYKGSETTYVTFFEYDEQGCEWAENQEVAATYYIQVDIWSKADYSAIEEKVRLLMRAAGFFRVSATEFYEDDTKFFHKAIRFSYTG
jgi:hypothetical protein